MIESQNTESLGKLWVEKFGLHHFDETLAQELAKLLDEQPEIDSHCLDAILKLWEKQIDLNEEDPDTSEDDRLEYRLIAACIYADIKKKQQQPTMVEEELLSMELVMKTLHRIRCFRPKKKLYIYVSQFVLHSKVIHKASGKSDPYAQLGKLYEKVTGITPTPRSLTNEQSLPHRQTIMHSM